MNLYLDTEFDGHGGSLIALAIAGDDGSSWYGIFDAHCGTDWVAANVAPKLYAMEPTISGSHDTLRLSLAEFLRPRSGCHIWADWPADFEHLTRLMVGSTYVGSFMVPCVMHLIETPIGEPKPEHPHNALSDALALMRWHQKATPDYANSLKWAAHDEHRVGSMWAAFLQGWTLATERAASLHESVNPASDEERGNSVPGAGAMGAVIEYRDAIRRPV